MIAASVYTIEVVYVGSAAHLRRYKVMCDGRYVTGGLFRTYSEALAFIAAQTS